MGDLYEVLGVSRSASPAEIKKAYRRLAKENHPDRHGGDKSKEARFKEVSAAYHVLGDEGRRRKYDHMGQGGGPEGQGHVDLSDLFAGFGGGGGFSIEDLLGGIMGGGFRQGGAGYGGAADGPQVVYEVRRDAPRPKAKSGGPTTVRSPKGVTFVRSGDDLSVTHAIGFDQAVLGAKVSVPTWDGQATVTIPPGTSSGRRLRLRGKGVGGRGDQFVDIQIKVPKKVSKEAAELLREFTRKAPT